MHTYSHRRRHHGARVGTCLPLLVGGLSKYTFKKLSGVLPPDARFRRGKGKGPQTFQVKGPQSRLLRHLMMDRQLVQLLEQASSAFELR